MTYFINSKNCSYNYHTLSNFGLVCHLPSRLHGLSNQHRNFFSCINLIKLCIKNQRIQSQQKSTHWNKNMYVITLLINFVGEILPYKYLYKVNHTIDFQAAIKFTVKGIDREPYIFLRIIYTKQRFSGTNLLS